MNTRWKSIQFFDLSVSNSLEELEKFSRNFLEFKIGIESNKWMSYFQVSYTMENCTLNELQRQGSTHTPTKVNNLHLYNAQHTSFAFFEAPKYV